MDQKKLVKFQNFFFFQSLGSKTNYIYIYIYSYINSLNLFIYFFVLLFFALSGNKKKKIYIETTIGLRLASANISCKNNVRIFGNYFIYLFIYSFKYFFSLFPIKRRRSQERNLIGSRLLKDGISKLLLFTSFSFLHIIDRAYHMIDKAHIDTQYNTFLEYINKFTQVYVWQKKKF